MTCLKIVEMNVNDIIPYMNNPRKNEAAVEKVAASIAEFGFKVPIIVDKDNVVVAGHTRLKAALQLGIEKVPAIKAADLTEEQVKAFRLADNKVSEFAEWDFDALADELAELDSVDMSQFGFDELASKIDWASVDDLTEDNYDKPEKEQLECPFCHKRDIKAHFKAVEC